MNGAGSENRGYVSIGELEIMALPILGGGLSSDTIYVDVVSNES